MIPEKTNDNWKYSADDRKGDAKFDGLPCPTKKVFDIIGVEGINEIDKIFKDMISWKKYMYGNNSELLGFFPHASFFNSAKKITLGCKEFNILPADSEEDKKKLYLFPERVSPENYRLMFSNEIFELIEN